MTDKKTPKPEDLTDADLDKVAGGGKLLGDDIGVPVTKKPGTKDFGGSTGEGPSTF